MVRLFRYRCIIIRSIILWLFAITMIKLTTILYYDLQQQSIDTSSIVLPNDDNKFSKEQILPSINLTINRTAINISREFVQRKNREQFMYNSNLFSSETTRYILLVQVHTRVVYLKKFIEMLQRVELINQTLLIFSHDFIDPEINILVTNITFAPVIQIFYPFSQQLYPDEFPGLDPDDCPRDLAKYRALANRCKNAPYPDKYGHYREVSIVQIKHHWWWKVSDIYRCTFF
jgi:alpha-1,6-mannosyl-glycoprotein beta-1,2-N-acetylglucosaminyltransferase